MALLPSPPSYLLKLLPLRLHLPGLIDDGEVGTQPLLRHLIGIGILAVFQEDVVGTTIRRKDDDFGARSFTIIGVVKDLVKDSPFQATEPAIMFLTDSEEGWCESCETNTVMASTELFMELGELPQ